MSMNMFRAYGPAARGLAHLGWWLLIVAALVTAVVGALVLLASVRRRAGRAGEVPAAAGVASGLPWIYVGGVAVPALILVVSLVFTLGTVRAVAAPPRHPAATVRIVGHRWWWELTYLGGDGTAPAFVTANELHVPVGQPVRLELTSADVIHSYWVPQLAGKMDLNPGATNVTWIEADTEGVYRGQCTEYCGEQHANMATLVVAESPAKFTAWLAAQRAAALAPAAPAAAAGRLVFERSACASCHTIRGTAARGRVGPDLTHLAGRLTLAAGTLANARGALAGWIANAQALKPGNVMPTMALPPRELHELVAYLQTLK
jgi:cytochrome c oxidase subunit 2